MCYFGGFHNSVCRHTEYRAIILCQRLDGDYSGCVPVLPDAHRGVAGTVIQHNMVIPDRIRPGPVPPQHTAQYAGLPQPQSQSNYRANGVQVQQPVQGPISYPMSGLCSNCVFQSMRVTEIHRTQPNFGLTNDMILNEERMQAYFQRNAVSDYPQPLGIADQNPGAMVIMPNNNSNSTMVNSNVDLFNHNQGPTYPTTTSWFGRSHENGYQSGPLGTQSYNIQQQGAGGVNPFPTTSNPYSGGNDFPVYPQPRSRIIRNLGMPEDPFLNSSNGPAAIPTLFQPQQASSKSDKQHRGKKVRFEERTRNQPADTPTRYRPSKLQTKALRLTKAARRSTAAATSTRGTRPEVARPEVARPEVRRPEVPQATTRAEANPKPKPKERLQGLSARWQSALRSRPKSTSEEQAE